MGTGRQYPHPGHVHCKRATLIGLISIWLVSVNAQGLRSKAHRMRLAHDPQYLSVNVCCVQQTQFSTCNSESKVLYSAYSCLCRSGRQALHAGYCHKGYYHKALRLIGVCVPSDHVEQPDLFWWIKLFLMTSQ